MLRFLTQSTIAQTRGSIFRARSVLAPAAVALALALSIAPVLGEDPPKPPPAQTVTSPPPPSAPDKKPNYYGEFSTHILAGGDGNELKIPVKPDVQVTFDGEDKDVDIIWEAPKDTRTCPNLKRYKEFKGNKQDCDKISNPQTANTETTNTDNDAVAPNGAKMYCDKGVVLSKKRVPNDDSSSLLIVRVPEPPCRWPVTQYAHITVKGKVAGQSSPSTFFEESIPVSVTWFPLSVTILVVALIYPGCAMAVWFMKDRQYKRRRREAEGKGEVLKEEAPSFFATLDPVQITANPFGRASLGKLQIFLFSIIVFAILFFYQLRCGLLAGLSTDVLYLMGISAVGAAGGKIANTSKRRLKLENWAWLRRKEWLPERKDVASRARWSELFLDGDTKEFDPYGFQMAVFSVVVAVALIRTNLAGLGTFTIPPELLQLLGLSQVVFIGGKAIEKSPYNELDDKLTEVRRHELEYQKLVAKQVTPKPVPAVDPAAPPPNGAKPAVADGAQGKPEDVKKPDDIKDPEVERTAFKESAAQAAEMFWAVYGDQIGDKPKPLDDIDDIEPALPSPPKPTDGASPSS